MAGRLAGGLRTVLGAVGRWVKVLLVGTSASSGVTRTDYRAATFHRDLGSWGGDGGSGPS